MRVENASYPHSAELSPEFSSNQLSPVGEKHFLASGGNRLILPPDIKDLQYESHRRRVEARSKECFNAFTERIQKVRQRIQKEYGHDLVLNDPPHIVPHWEKRNQRFDETGLSYFVKDLNGDYLPHMASAVIRDQRLYDEDTEISGVHWIEGHHFLTDPEEENQIQLGEFIMGPDGPETVVEFQFYVRKDGHWFYKRNTNYHEASLVTVLSESVVFEENNRIA